MSEHGTRCGCAASAYNLAETVHDLFERLAATERREEEAEDDLRRIRDFLDLATTSEILPQLKSNADSFVDEIYRLNAQLATARKALHMIAIGGVRDVHVAAGEALAAMDKDADGAEPSWEDAAMQRQSDAALKAVVETADNVLIAFDRFIEGRHDGVDFVYEQLGGPMEELRGVLFGVLHGAKPERENGR